MNTKNLITLMSAVMFSLQIIAQTPAKEKEVQRHPQADTELHHICFCPNAPLTRQIIANFSTFDN